MNFQNKSQNVKESGYILDRSYKRDLKQTILKKYSPTSVQNHWANIRKCGFVWEVVDVQRLIDYLQYKLTMTVFKIITSYILDPAFLFHNF